MKNYAIILHTDQEVYDLYALNLEIFLGLAPQILTSYEQFRISLDRAKDIALIVVPIELGDDKTLAKKIVSLLKSKHLKIPIYIFGRDESIVYDNMSMSSSELEIEPEIRDFLGKCAKMLDISAKDMALKRVPDMFPIPIKYLNYVKQTNFDLYIRVVKVGEDPHYIKRVYANDEIKEGFVQHYTAKGMKFLYIEKDNRLKFTTEITNVLLETLKKKYLSMEQRIDANETSVHLARSMVMDNLITDDLKELSEKTVGSILQVAKKSQGIMQLYTKLTSNRINFFYTHCQFINFFANHVIEKMRWGSAQQSNVLGFVSFFHDIALPGGDDRDLSRIHTKEDIEAFNLTKEEEELVLNHAARDADILSNLKQIPFGADSIVRQHHGSMIGHGFAEEYSIKLPTMAVVFMICEDLAHGVIKYLEGRAEISQKEKDKFTADLIAKLYLKYDKLTHKKILDCIKTVKW